MWSRVKALVSVNNRPAEAPLSQLRASCWTSPLTPSLEEGTIKEYPSRFSTVSHYIINTAHWPEEGEREKKKNPLGLIGFPCGKPSWKSSLLQTQQILNIFKRLFSLLYMAHDFVLVSSERRPKDAEVSGLGQEKKKLATERRGKLPKGEVRVCFVEHNSKKALSRLFSCLPCSPFCMY